jgi:hypothetical protein
MYALPSIASHPLALPNSTIVVGTNIMLIGGLLKVTVHLPGWVRPVLNCAPARSLPRCVALDWVIIFSCEEPYRSDRKPALRRCIAASP